MLPVFWSAPTPKKDFMVEGIDPKLFGREPGLDVLSGLVEGGCREGMLGVANESQETILIEPGDVLATLAAADPEEILVLDSRVDCNRLLLGKVMGFLSRVFALAPPPPRRSLSLACLRLRIRTPVMRRGKVAKKGRRR